MRAAMICLGLALAVSVAAAGPVDDALAKRAFAEAVAADGDGKIKGRISKGDKGVAGVVILVLELRTVEVSDASGEFVFKNVPPGIYNLNFTLGDGSENKTGVGVVAGETREITLEVDWDLGVYESITVTAAAERARKIVDAPAAVTSLGMTSPTPGAARKKPVPSSLSRTRRRPRRFPTTKTVSPSSVTSASRIGRAAATTGSRPCAPIPRLSSARPGRY